jgi:hypothetical protein
VLSPATSDSIRVPKSQEFADVVRQLRLLIGKVEASSSSVTLAPDGALLHAACRLLDPSPEQREAMRTALMVLRDLVRRVDSVRNVLVSNAADPAVAEALGLHDKSEIHLFLRQEP